MDPLRRALVDAGLDASSIEKVLDLGVDSVEGLRGMVEASPLAFRRHVGGPATDAIERLLARVRPRGGVRLFTLGQVGARLEPRDGSPLRPLDEATREELFRALEQLRAKMAPTAADLSRMRELEAQIEALYRDPV